MSRVSSALGVLFATFTILAGLLVVDPFYRMRAALIEVLQAGSDQAKVSSLYQDWKTQETSNGQNPVPGLERLSEAWRECGDRDRVLIMGNSQTFSMILAPGERPQGNPEKTYPDLVFAHYNNSRQPLCVYRLSAPNISYMEALWYLRYLLVAARPRPTRLVLQLNYETFRKSDVRDSLLDMLAQSEFRVSIQKEATLDRDYSATFDQALRRHEELIIKRGQSDVAKDNKTENGTASTGIARSFGFGNRVEATARSGLDHLPGWQRRHTLKSSFLDVLYLLRVHILRISPTTKRAIGGAALSANLSSLDAIAELCKTNKIELALFDAPQNPSAPLYLNETYKNAYEQMIRDFAKNHEARFFDFEESIPDRYWGVWVDGPDPIHFGREGHARMAQLMIESGIFTLSR